MKKYFKTDISRQQKVLLVIGGMILLMVISIILYSWFAPRKGGPASTLSGANITGSQTKKTESAEDRSQTEAYNQQQSANAIRNNQTFLAVPTGNPAPLNFEDQSTKTPAVIAQATPHVYGSSTPRSRPVTEQTMKAAEAVLKSLQAGNVYSAPTYALVQQAPNYESQFQPTTSLSPSLTSNPGTGNVSKPKSVVIFPAFKLCPARLQTELDTDTNSIVTGTLSCNELFKAVIQAPGYKLVGENIDMTFTAMTLNGKPYKITAKPIDLKTGRSMLSGNVDHRYMSRILIPALALGVAKVGSLYENSSEQSTYVSDGTVVQSSTGKVSAAQVNGTFIGGLASQTASVMNADAARVPPINVTRDGDNSTIGIMFLEPVLDSDAMDVSSQIAATAPSGNATQTVDYSTPAAAAQIQQQQQQQLMQQTTQSPELSRGRPYITPRTATGY